jgi:hypothetical protein
LVNGDVIDCMHGGIRIKSLKFSCHNIRKAIDNFFNLFIRININIYLPIYVDNVGTFLHKSKSTHLGKKV